VIQRKASFIDTDLAIRLNEGEQFVEAIISHEEEDGALYFEVAWTSGSKSEEPLENLVDISAEWTVNSALEPYICTLKQIMAGTDVLEESEPDSGLRCLMDIENMRE
jgi:hypothetical protein